MGFNRRIINDKKTISHLLDGSLSELYNCDNIIIDDNFSSFVRHLFLDKKSESEILKILNIKKEETKNEMY
jgi:hypothetical protein